MVGDRTPSGECIEKRIGFVPEKVILRRGMGITFGHHTRLARWASALGAPAHTHDTKTLTRDDGCWQSPKNGGSNGDMGMTVLILGTLKRLVTRSRSCLTRAGEMADKRPANSHPMPKPSNHLQEA